MAHRLRWNRVVTVRAEVRVRGGRAAATREPPREAPRALLSRDLAPVRHERASRAPRQPPRGVPQLLRSTLPPVLAGAVGGRLGDGVRIAAVRHRGRARDRALHERHHLLHARPRRRSAARRARAAAHRRRVGAGLRVPGDRDRLLPGALPGVFAARGQHLPARRPGRLTAQRGPAAAPPPRARHAVVDLAQVFGTAPRAPAADRLPAPMLAQLRAELATAGFHLAEGAAVDAGLVKLREMYEPYVEALSRYLLQPLPPWHQDRPRRDNWQTSAWDRRRVSD